MSTLSYAAVVRDIKRQLNELMGIAEKEINDNDLLVENLGCLLYTSDAADEL